MRGNRRNNRNLGEREAVAVARYVRVQPRKARLVADMVRGMNAEKAINLLRIYNKKAATPIRKTIMSAVSNMENILDENKEPLNYDADKLYVKKIFIDEGPTYKRLRARAMGRGSRILKRTSHITVIVSDE